MKLTKTTPADAVKDAALQDLEALEVRIAALEAKKAPQPKAAEEPKEEPKPAKKAAAKKKGKTK